MLSRDDVIGAYKVMLGREPESEQVIEGQRQVDELKTLVASIANGQEFGERMGFLPKSMGIDFQPLPVEVDTSPENLAALLARTGETWAELGQADAHWSVLTNPIFARDNVADGYALFYATGRSNRDELLATLRIAGRQLPADARCIDYGCGVGRLSLAFAEVTAEVEGVDISAPHLALAEEAARDRGFGNVRFTRVGTLPDIEALAPCDLLVSLIVLQHNPPPVQRAILAALLGRLKPGGIAVFQTLTFQPSYSFVAADYLAHPRAGHMEMHLLPQRHVFATAAEAGCLVVEVRDDMWNGGSRDCRSQTFVVERPR